MPDIEMSCVVHDLPPDQAVARLIEFAGAKNASDLLFALIQRYRFKSRDRIFAVAGRI